MTLIIRYYLLFLVLMVLLASCVAAPEQQRGKVLCPACGTEFDALYQQRF